MDYKKLYDDSSAELEELKKKQAVLKSQIEDKATALGLTVDETLIDQIREKQSKLKEEIAENEEKMQALVNSLEEKSLSIDEDKQEPVTVETNEHDDFN